MKTTYPQARLDAFDKHYAGKEMFWTEGAAIAAAKPGNWICKCDNQRGGHFYTIHRKFINPPFNKPGFLQVGSILGCWNEITFIRQIKKHKPTLASVKPVCNAELDEPSHSPGAIKAAEIIMGDDEFIFTTFGRKRIEGLAALIDNQTHAPELLAALDKIAEIAAAGVIHRNETGKPQWSAFDEIKSIIARACRQEATE